MTINTPVEIPRPQKLDFGNDRNFLFASTVAKNDRVVRLALDGDTYNQQIVEGQKLYQKYTKVKGAGAKRDQGVIRTVETHDFALAENITKPDPSTADNLLGRDREIMENQEGKAAKVIATQLGFIYQAMAEEDFPTAVIGLNRQKEILDSPPIVESIVTRLVAILESNVSRLPQYKELLEEIEVWQCFSNSEECKALLDPLVEYAYLEKGITLSRNSGDEKKNSPYQLIESIATSHIRATEDIGYLDEGELKQYLSSTLSEESTAERLAKDRLLAGKLLKSIIDNPEIFNKLHPRVQGEFNTVLRGFLLDSGVEESKLGKVLKSKTVEIITNQVEPVTTEAQSISSAPPAEAVKPPIDDNSLYFLNNLSNIAELTPVVNQTHETIKGEAAAALARAAREEFTKIFNGVTKKEKGLIFKKPYIPIREYDRIDKERHTLEESPEYQSRNPKTVARVIALRLVKKHINIFNGVKE